MPQSRASWCVVVASVTQSPGNLHLFPGLRSVGEFDSHCRGTEPPCNSELCLGGIQREACAACMQQQSRELQGRS